MTVHKRALRSFLSHNPFAHPLTQGFFFREKMRAIHRIAPDEPVEHILEVGGGRGGLTTLLYPRATVINVDLDNVLAGAPCNRRRHVYFVCGDGARLPFRDDAFDAVTLFDVLEHIPNDRDAIAECLRVTRHGGVMLVSAPNETWRFPYHRFMRDICPTEEAMWREWGHVRRGYSLKELDRLIAQPCQGWANFITPLTVFSHDVAFSHLPSRVRQLACLGLTPLTWTAYALHRPHAAGTETASVWRKVAAT